MNDNGYVAATVRITSSFPRNRPIKLELFACLTFCEPNDGCHLWRWNCLPIIITYDHLGSWLGLCCSFFSLVFCVVHSVMLSFSPCFDFDIAVSFCFWLMILNYKNKKMLNDSQLDIFSPETKRHTNCHW